ncbi:MAG: hypothetical protein K6B46_02710 [Opitutales bacterium]|nr:hypothetical protein [Opitutales bacterium]
MNKIVSSFLLTSAAIALVPGAMADDDEAAALYLEAESAYSQKDYTTAVEKYRAYLELDPTNEQAKVRLVESEKGAAAIATAESTPATVTDSSTDFEKIVNERQALYAEAATALAEAEELIALGNVNRALRLLDEVESALSNTPASAPYFDRINAIRHDALAGQHSVTTEEMTDQARRDIREGVVKARRALEKGREERSGGYLADAIQSLNEAKKILPNVTSCAELSKEIDEERALVYTAYFFQMVDNRSANEALTYLKYVEDLLGPKHRIYVRLKAFYDEWRQTADAQNPATINPAFIRAEANGMEALHRAKAQYMYGDYHGALDSYSQALLYLPDNAEAKAMQIKIRKILANSGAYNRELTREVMLGDIDEKWRMAQVFTAVSTAKEEAEEQDPLVARMKRIKVPVSLKDAPLQRALETLSELSQTYDEVGKGVDIVLIDPEQKKAKEPISITMSATSLDKVLDLVLRQIGCSYQVKDGVVQVTPNLSNEGFENEEFTVQPKVVARMVGRKAGGDDDGGSAFGGGSDESAGGSEDAAIKSFLARAGVSWEGGRSLVYDSSGNLLLVTTDSKNMDRIKNVLKSLNSAETKQVNIEAKFIEVNSDALNQVVMNWQATRGEGENMFVRSATNNRTITGAHYSVAENSVTTIEGPDQVYTNDDGDITATTEGLKKVVSQKPPQVPRQPPLNPYYGSDALPTFSGVIGTIGDYDLRMVLNALDSKSGTDIMAAPSLTVQSEQEANIKIVQLLRWPQSYDDMQIQVSSSNGYNNNNNNNNSSGSSSVGITPGTPQFDEDATEVGIQLRVQPSVNKEEGSITFSGLNASIKEFEGFVEYGGTAVAIASGTVVTTPAGFFQPVFNLREVETTVEVFDGGTIVIGGLTREEIRTVNDKVPILGDLPLIGSAFRSTGKSVTKKNLLIFVTANLIARGGGTEEGNFKGVQRGATYSNPTLFISSGPTYRDYDAEIVSEENVKVAQ